MTKMCQAPDPNPKRSRLQAPPGATDTHFHIFGPEDRYPYVPDRRFTPPDASVESYLRMHRTLGLSRAVLVHPKPEALDLGPYLRKLGSITHRLRDQLAHQPMQRIDIGGERGEISNSRARV